MTTQLIGVDGFSPKEIEELQKILYLKAVEYAKMLKGCCSFKREFIIDNTRV